MNQDPKKKIIESYIEDEMKSAYIDYAMSVIVSRALPDIRDGLKPVHRRVLYGIHELGLYYNKPFRKAARIVGDVLGKFHPHSDDSVYDAMVRLAQDWALRYPLIDGQGNFGSVDGDAPAAMRYTEARLKKISEELLDDIDKNTIDFQPNFDDSLQEPVVLPSKIPNLLINGSAGIAVGMATNMPPHNLSEVINGIMAYINQPEITIPELMEYIIAPDFPTGGIIYGTQGIQEAYQKGKGIIILRSKTDIEKNEKGKECIIVTEIPYMVNKAVMVEKTAQLINNKKIEGIIDIRDESNKDGIRIVYELKKEAQTQVVLNNLFKYTSLQVSFGINNVALVNTRPKVLNLKEIIHHFVEHRKEVVTRRTQYNLAQAEKKFHIFAGYLIILNNLDEVIQIIRNAQNAEVAKENLMKKYNLSEVQIKAILELKLQRLTNLEREKTLQTYQELEAYIKELKKLLATPELIIKVIKEELLEIQKHYGDKRKTVIEYQADEISIEDIIPNEEMVITISHEGYIKRTPLVDYKKQSRGGKGSKGMGSKQDDFIKHLSIASTHDYLLIFTVLGKVYWKKVYELPEGAKIAKGRPIQNLINIEQEDSIRSIIKVNNLDKAGEYIKNKYLIMCTKKGIIKKTRLKEYANPMKKGIQAIKIYPGDKLLEVKLTTGGNEIIMASNSGKAIRFKEDQVKPVGRTSFGMRGIKLSNQYDHVIGMVKADKPNMDLLVVSEKGFGKKSLLKTYRLSNRAGKGVKTLQITDKIGSLVAIKAVTDQDEFMIMTKKGLTIRMSINKLPIRSRNTQGVRLIKIHPGDAIASVAKIRDINLVKETELT